MQTVETREGASKIEIVFHAHWKYDCGVVITNAKFDLNLTEVGQQSVTGTYQFR